MRSVMVRTMLLVLGLAQCALAARAQDAALGPFDPEDGRIDDGTYVNRYFGVSYPLLPGWAEGVAGPQPSHRGYYVLSLMLGPGERGGMMLIAAQDTFFAAPQLREGAAAAREVGAAMAAVAGHTIDVPPSRTTIAGRPFDRVDYSGFGLYRSVLITPIRCHLVSFNITAPSPELRTSAVGSLERLGLPDPEAGSGDPVCKADQASAEQVVRRVDPAPSAPYAPPIPVRLIIGAHGGVNHVHVIRGAAQQRTAIASALSRWQFRPPALDPGATALETGLLVQFSPTGGVTYLSGDRAPPG